MKLQKQLTLLQRIVLFLIAMIMVANCKENPKKTYKPTFESLDSHPTPKWFTDAKFGIFIHWGVYSVPAFHEWYVEFISPRSTWGKRPEGPPYTAAQGDLPDSVFKLETMGYRGVANQYHRQNYGVDFEYDSFIPMFKAENFDPAAWADLFVKSGARYVVLTAKHGEEFAMWPSKFTKRKKRLYCHVV